MPCFEKHVSNDNVLIWSSNLQRHSWIDCTEASRLVSGYIKIFVEFLPLRRVRDSILFSALCLCIPGSPAYTDSYRHRRAEPAVLKPSASRPVSSCVAGPRILV